MDTLEEALAHYGIKGMKWGVRRKNPSASEPGSEDSERAEAAKSKAKAKGSKALSNRELQDLINRMNLEQQYERLRPRTGKEKALKFIGDTLVNVGKQQVSKLAAEGAAKALTSLLTKR